MSDDPDDVETWKRRVGREWAVLAWPPRQAPGERLRDLFDGLPDAQDDQVS
jgi:hypothetical protein